MRWVRFTSSSRSPPASRTPTTFVTADKGRYVLTLYERLPAEELPFYLNLMAHLARAGVQAPAPEPDRTGALWSFLNGKPAGLVARLDGRPVMRTASPPLRGGRRSAGAAASSRRRHYRGRLTNRRGPGWWRQAARAVRPFLSAEQNALLAAELKLPDRLRQGASCRAARSTATSSATTCCSSDDRVSASSISASPRPMPSPTTSRSPSTTGARSPTRTRSAALDA